MNLVASVGTANTLPSVNSAAALDAMRPANAPASLALYGICGVIRLYRGSLKELLVEVRAAVRRDGTR